ncbi:MAG: enoyl-CoA hydratase/isomerase family protein [Planctomycetaceae bacterium]
MPNFVRIVPIVPGVSAVVLQRSEQRNALSIELVGQLCDAIEALARQPEQRVVILRGDGPVFSAGLDLREAMDDALIERSAAGVKRVLALLKNTPLVTIAAVQGGRMPVGRA